VQTPGSTTPVEARTGKLLAYGTTIRTARGASLVIILSEDNTCTIGGNAVLTMAEDPSDPTRKILELHRGKADIALEEGYREQNTLTVLTRCTAANILKGGASSVDARTEADLRVVVIVIQKGEIEASGPQFEIPLLADKSAVTIACAEDLSFIRLRDIQGEYDVQVDEADGKTRLVEMVKDSVIKILRKTSEVDANILIVTVLEVHDGRVADDILTYSTELVNEGMLALAVPVGDEPPPKGLGDPFEPSSSSSSSSSSSTVVGPDAVPPPPTPTPPPPRRRRPPPVTPTGST